MKLTHDRWIGPWTITAVITPGLCYRVNLQGRREIVRRAAASHIKPYPLRPPSLRHEFGDKYAHFAWGPDIGLAAASTLTSPVYTLMDRCPIQLSNVSWEWRCRGRYLNGSLSGFFTEEGECFDSFIPLQLDAFHALWELYHRSHHRPRLATKLTNSKRLAAYRSYALLEMPIGTVVWRDFTDYKTPSWRVRHSDAEWEELTRTEVKQERDTPLASTKLSSKVSKEKGRKTSAHTDTNMILGIVQGYLL